MKIRAYMMKLNKLLCKRCINVINCSCSILEAEIKQFIKISLILGGYLFFTMASMRFFQPSFSVERSHLR